MGNRPMGEWSTSAAEGRALLMSDMLADEEKGTAIRTLSEGRKEATRGSSRFASAIRRMLEAMKASKIGLPTS